MTKLWNKQWCAIVLSIMALSQVASSQLVFQEKWNTPPQTWPATEADYQQLLDDHYPDLTPIYFSGPTYREKETRVFAVYGIPEVPAGEKVPGVVLVHGGGGTAFAKWVDMWVKRGYAAIAMDCNGSRPLTANEGKGCSARHEHGGPGGWGGFLQMDDPLGDQWTTQSIEGVIRAHTLLRSFPEVDTDRIGITGISWGGFLTSMVASIDQRFTCAVPVYGCGYIYAGDCAWKKPFAAMSPEQLTRWKTQNDPSAYLPNLTTPTLWINGTNDFAYGLNSWQASHQLSKGTKTLSLGVAMRHSHTDGWAPVEIEAFMNQHLRGGEALIAVTGQGVNESGKAWASFETSVPVAKAVLNYTMGTGPSQEFEWKTIEAKVYSAKGKVVAQIPKGTTSAYFNLTDTQGHTVSSDFVIAGFGL